MRPEQQALRMGDSASAPFGLVNTTEVSWSKTNMVSKKIMNHFVKLKTIPSAGST